MITHKPKKLISILIFVLLLMATLIACTFTNAKVNTVSDISNTLITTDVSVAPNPNTVSTAIENNHTIVPDPEYSFTGGKSDKSELVIAAGTYPEDNEYLAFEGDFDSDGETEAFVLIGMKSNDGISGDLWYVNDSDTATLLLQNIYAEASQQIFQKTINSMSYIYFLFTYKSGNSYLTDIYSVWDDNAMLCFDADGYAQTTRKVLIGGGDLVFTDEEYDFIYQIEDAVSTGHTVKYYTFHFLDSGSFQQYTTEEKTKNEFLTYEGADTALQTLEEEYHPDAYQFIYRSNGEWDINMAVDNGDNYTFYNAVYGVGADNRLALKSTGEGYFRLDMLSDNRDFLHCLLYGKGDHKSDWLTLASKHGLAEAAASDWYERFLKDGILQNESYYIFDLITKDLDDNGQSDLMLITEYDTRNLANLVTSNRKHAYIYMNQDAVYELSLQSELIFDWAQSVSADFDQDGYIEIAYSINTGGVGAAGSYEKGMLKYKNHTLIPMLLPNDFSEEDQDTGIQVNILAGKERNQYIAFCPYLNSKVSFQRKTASDHDENTIREGDEVGGNVRGYSQMEVLDENGSKVLILREYLHGENGINDGIADAVFTVRFNEKEEAYIADFSIDPY